MYSISKELFEWIDPLILARRLIEVYGEPGLIWLDSDGSANGRWIILAADPIIQIVGPGLEPEIHQIAVIQLQVMAPIALLAGLIGLGFGSLNANDAFLIPAISPLISSMVLVTFIGTFWFKEGGLIESSQFGIKGGLILALGTLIGALFLWLIQIPSLINKNLNQPSLSNSHKNKSIF